ncbi:MAG: hypothetical protein PVF45_13115 [Anaerolineae bacterium]|jgi:hypothetical protein
MIELNFPDPVTSEDGFFDRQKEWTLIERTFRSRERKPLIILGERRIGKTSLQSVAASRLSHHLEPLFLPFGPLLRSADDFARELLQGLCSSSGKSMRETGPFTANGDFGLGSFGEYTQALRSATSQEKDYLVCVDEFDVTLKNCADKEAKRLVALVTHLVNEGDRRNLPLRFFFSMTGMPETVTKSFSTSFTSNATLAALKPFSYENTAKMVTTLLGPGAHVSQAAMTRLFDLSGGHPYLTKLLLYWLLEPHGFEAQGLVVDEGALEGALAQATHDPQVRGVLANLYDVHFNQEQKGLMLMLASPERQNGVTKQELQAMGTNYITAANTLKRRGYLQVADESAPYCVRIAFLRQWLYQWERYEVEAERRLG